MSNLQAAITEAYACSKSDVAEIVALEISHPSIVGSVYLVNNNVDLTLKLEDGYKGQTPGPNVLFTACPFRFRRPSVNADGIQELQLSVDNVDRRLSDFLGQTVNFSEKVTCIYRVYLSNDLQTPQLVPPLELALTDVDISLVEVTARASFADLVNKIYPSQFYYRSIFPGLGS